MGAARARVQFWARTCLYARVRACRCRLRLRGKARSKTMAERLLIEDIERNRLAQMRAIAYLLLAASEGLIRGSRCHVKLRRGCRACWSAPKAGSRKKGRSCRHPDKRGESCLHLRHAHQGQPHAGHYQHDPHPHHHLLGGLDRLCAPSPVCDACVP